MSQQLGVESIFETTYMSKMPLYNTARMVAKSSPEVGVMVYAPI